MLGSGQAKSMRGHTDSGAKMHTQTPNQKVMTTLILTQKELKQSLKR